MRWLGRGFLLTLFSIAACHSSPRDTQSPTTAVAPPYVLSPELRLTGTIVDGDSLLLTLRNLAQRKVLVETGIAGFPLGNFQFGLELPNHSLVSVVCTCQPSSSPGKVEPYFAELQAKQEWHAAVPLRSLRAAVPVSGSTLLRALHGTLTSQLQVPTPPGAPSALTYMAVSETKF